MKDTGLRKKVVSQLFDPAPGHPILLAPTSERAAPKIGDAMPECVQCTTDGRHRVVCKEAGYDLPQSFPLIGDWLMLRRCISFLISSSVARIRSPRDFRFRAKRPRRDRPQMNVKPRKLKVSGLPSPHRSRWSAAKRPNSIRRVFSR
jgi:hypothetical protein